MAQAEAGAAPARTLLPLDGAQIPAPQRLVGGVRILVPQRQEDGVTTRVRLQVVLGGTLAAQVEVGAVQVSRPVVGMYDMLTCDCLSKMHFEVNLITNGTNKREIPTPIANYP